MSDYLTEAQQVEALKNFWKENGFTIVASIVLAIAIVTGMRFYRSYVRTRAEHASVVYQHMITSDVENNVADAETQAALLIKDYSRTPYSKLAALMLAKQLVNAKKYDDAINQLNWVIKHTNNHSFADIARIRLARVYLEQNKANDALKSVEKIKDKAYQGLSEEMQGDAFVQLNQLDQARTAYQAALKEYQDANISRPFLEMKMNDLPGAAS
jgi:predicted negative regulator of RcsB-dependent stress response